MFLLFPEAVIMCSTSLPLKLNTVMQTLMRSVRIQPLPIIQQRTANVLACLVYITSERSD